MLVASGAPLGEPGRVRIAVHRAPWPPTAAGRPRESSSAAAPRNPSSPGARLRSAPRWPLLAAAPRRRRLRGRPQRRRAQRPPGSRAGARRHAIRRLRLRPHQQAGALLGASHGASPTGLGREALHGHHRPRPPGPADASATTVFGVGQLAPGGIWNGNLYLSGGGDPTFGSRRSSSATTTAWGPAYRRLPRAWWPPASSASPAG